MISGMHHFLIAALFWIFVSGCSSHSGLKADLGKLRPWSVDLERSQPLPPPYVADFEAGTKALTYLAFDPSNDRSSASMILLGQVMGARRYSVVLLGGFPRSLGTSPLGPKMEAEKDAHNSMAGYYSNGEATMAVLEAVKRKIPFVGAEPDEDLIKRAVATAGYNLEDLFGLYITRLIPQWKRDGTLTRESFEEVYFRARMEIGKRLGLPEAQTPERESFIKWYAQKNKQSFRLRDIKSETTAPFPTGSLFTQRIAAVADRVRNEHILRVTEEMLNHYGRVLLVFSASHFPVQQLALESMLGKPVRISDQL